MQASIASAASHFHCFSSLPLILFPLCATRITLARRVYKKSLEEVTKKKVNQSTEKCFLRKNAFNKMHMLNYEFLHIEKLR